MAKNNLSNYQTSDGFGMSLNIRRGNPDPLDNSSVWASLTAAQNYAKDDPTAYVGQVLTVATATESKAYIIANEAGELVEVIDAKAQKVTIDQKVDLQYDSDLQALKFVFK